MKKGILSFFFLSLLSYTSYGQKEAPTPNFFEIKKRIEKQLDKDDQAEDGKKARYYRWYHSWRYRLGPNGEMTTANKIYNEQMQSGILNGKRRGNLNCSPYDDNIFWQNLGPFDSKGALGSNNGSWSCPGRLPKKQNQGRIESISVNPNNMNEILVGAYNGGIWRTTDGGANWTITTDDEGYSIFGFNAIVRHPKDSKIIYASSSLGCGGWEGTRKRYGMGVIMSTDGGVSWQPTGLNYQNHGHQLSQINKLIIDPKSTLTNTILYVGMETQLKKYVGHSNAQNGWSTIHSNYSYSNGPHWYGNVQYNDIITDHNNSVWFSNYTGIFRYDGSVSYPVSSYTIPAPFSQNNSCGNNNGATNGGLRQHTNIEINKQGHIVMVIAYTDCNNYKKSDGTNEGVGTKVYLYRSTNHGASWSTPVDVTGKIGAAVSAVSPNLVVDPNNSDILYSSGMGSILCAIKTTDFGANFSYTNNGDNHTDVRTFEAHDVGPKNTFFLGTDGGISKMTDGNKWNDITGRGLSITNYYGCGISETNDKIIFAGAQDGSVNFFNHGWWYETLPGGDNGDCLINPDDNEMVYQQIQGMLTRGKIVGNNVSINSTVSVGGWMNPLHWNPVDKSEFFIGTNYLYAGKTNSNALTQIANPLHSSDKKVSSVSISRNDPNTVYYSTESYVWNSSAIADDGIFKATRAGGSWTVTDITGGLKTVVHGKLGLSVPITDIAVDPNNKNRVWVTRGNFDNTKKVFYTPNGGVNWYNKTKTGLPNLPCTSIAFQELSNDRLYIGTDNGVYFTDNSMNCWEKYGNKGVQCQVNDLEINPCAGKLIAATHGRGLWEAPLIVKKAEKLPPGVTTWNSPKTLSSDLTIPSGAILYINNTTVNVGKDVTIYVEAGGKLELYNSTLTNKCGYTWKGIEVWGKNTAPQNAQQGRFKATLSTIEHAEKAIFVSKTTTPGTLSFNGGIIQAEHTKFLNNKRSVVYMKYTHPNSGYFKSCTFRTDANYRHPNSLMGHLTMWGVNGIEILGCTFENTNTWPYATNRVIGIGAVDASFKIGGHFTSTQSRQSVFKGFNRAISTGKVTGSPTFQITHTSFYDNVIGVHSTAHNNFIISSCSFNVGSNTISNLSVLNVHEGITVMSGTGFQIFQNSFQPAFSNHYPKTIGIRINQSGTENNEIYKNNFYKPSSSNNNIFYANLANGLNRDLSAPQKGLKYYCNTNSNNQKGYDFSVTDQGISSHQGAWTKSTGNTFSHGNVASGGNQYSDFNNGATTGNVVYFYRSIGQQKPLNTHQVAPYFVNNTNSCPARPIDIGGGTGGGSGGGDVEISQLFNSFNSNKKYLSAQEKTLSKKIDGGNTSEVNSMVKNATSKNYEAVINKLKEISPFLSKTIFESLIKKKEVFTPGNMIELAAKNPDVFIDGYLLNKMVDAEFISENDKTIIEEKIANNFTERTELENSIFSKTEENHTLCNKAIALIDRNPSQFTLQDKIEWLERKESIESELAIADIYMNTLQLNKAIEKLSKIKEKFILTNDQEQEIESFKQLKQIQFTIDQSGALIDQLEDQTITQLKKIASKSNGIAGDQARTILNQNDQNYFVPPVFPEITFKTLSGAGENGLPDGQVENKLIAAPNPAQSEVSFSYKIEKTGNFKLTILNHQGSIVKEMNINNEHGKVSWDCKELASGIYYYGILENGQTIVPYKKLVIIK